MRHYSVIGPTNQVHRFAPTKFIDLFNIFLTHWLFSSKIREECHNSVIFYECIFKIQIGLSLDPFFMRYFVRFVVCKTGVMEIQKREMHLQICAAICDCIQGFVCDECPTNIQVLKRISPWNLQKSLRQPQLLWRQITSEVLSGIELWITNLLENFPIAVADRSLYFLKYS